MANVRLVKSRVNEIKQRFEEASKPQSVALGDLLTDDFMQRRTPFKSLDDLIVSGGLDPIAITSFDDFDAEAFTNFIRERTEFASFVELRNAAVQERLAKQIFG